MLLLGLIPDTYRDKRQCSFTLQYEKAFPGKGGFLLARPPSLAAPRAASCCCSPASAPANIKDSLNPTRKTNNKARTGRQTAKQAGHRNHEHKHIAYHYVPLNHVSKAQCDGHIVLLQHDVSTPSIMTRPGIYTTEQADSKQHRSDCSQAFG